MKTTFSPTRWILILLCLAAWALPAPARAEAPNVLTYQGRLKENGAPVNGTRSVEILLCPTESGAGCEPTGPQGVSISSGLFRTTFTVPSAVNLRTGNWYLEVKVGAQTLSPRERLTASPYAVLASSASTLVPRAGDGDMVLVSNSRLILGAGGDGAPMSLILIGNGESSATIKLHNGAAGSFAGDWRMGVDNAGAWNLRGQAGTLNAVRATAGGAVGVGTTIPQARLDVSSAGAALTEVVFRVSSGSAAGQELLYARGDGGLYLTETAPPGSPPAGTGVFYVREDGGTPKAYFKNRNGTEYDLTAGGSSGWSDTVNGPIMDDPAKGVAIGTTLPHTRLHVAMRDGVTFTGDILKLSTGGIAGVDKTHLLVRRDGYVGVATEAPFSTMTIRGALGFDAIDPPAGPGANRGILYYDKAANRFKISENNGAFVNLGGGEWADDGVVGIYPADITRRVGIGNSSPLAALDVVNNAAMPYVVVVSTDDDGNDLTRRVLTVDGSGHVVMASSLTVARVAVGTASPVPDTALVVEGTATARLLGVTAPAGNGILRAVDAVQVGPTPDFALRHGYGTTVGNLTYHAFYVGGTVSATEAMRIHQSSVTVMGNEFSVGGSTLVVKGGRVGIGIANPSYALDVTGSANVAGFTGEYKMGGRNALSQFGPEFRHGYDAVAGAPPSQAFYAGGPAAAPALRLFFNEAKMGIGTASPEAAVHIATANVLPDAAVLKISTGTNFDALTVRSDGALLFGATGSTQTAAAMWQFLARKDCSSLVTCPIPVPSRRYVRVQAYITGKDASNMTALRINGDSSTNYHLRKSSNGAESASAMSAGFLLGESTSAAESYTLELTGMSAVGVILQGHGWAYAGANSAPDRRELAGLWGGGGTISSVDFVAALAGGQQFAAGTEIFVYGHD